MFTRRNAADSRNCAAVRPGVELEFFGRANAKGSGVVLLLRAESWQRSCRALFGGLAVGVWRLAFDGCVRVGEVGDGCDGGGDEGSGACVDVVSYDFSRNVCLL